MAVEMMVLLLIHAIMIISSIIISVAGDLNPMCGSDELLHCSLAGDFADGLTQLAVMGEIIMIPRCFNYSHGVDGYVYQYSDCVTSKDRDAYGNDLFCYNCLANLAEQILDGCPLKVGARYGTKDCCMRYEKYHFCDN